MTVAAVGHRGQLGACRCNLRPVTIASSPIRIVIRATDNRLVGSDVSAGKWCDVKKLIVIRNGRGILAEGDNTDELKSAYDQVAAKHKESKERHEFGLPNFDVIKQCDHEGDTGLVCIVNTADWPAVAKSYYHVGFVD